MTSTSPLRRTPLYGLHEAAGARLVEFAGWEMPVQYAGVIEEHLAVRRQAGLFDVSHMGEIEIRGGGALAAVQHLTSNDAARLSDGQAQYSALVTPQGTPVDDILVYRLAADRFLLCVNAANDLKDFEWIRTRLQDRAGGDAQAVHVSDDYAQIALQGPASAGILAGVVRAAVADLRPFDFLQDRLDGRHVLISRTGYTGEDGFEIYCAPGRPRG